MRDTNCKRCPLSQTCKSVCIPADGPERATLLVVGEAPGSDEDQADKPFVGRSGKLLRAALENLGVEYRITNVVRCRPPDNRTPSAEEMRACRVYLDQDLADMPNLKLLVLLGTTPKNAFGVKGKILELSGIPIFNHEDPKVPAMIPLAHPSYILRNQNYLPTWQAHWDVVKNILQPREDPADLIGARILDHVEEP